MGSTQNGAEAQTLVCATDTLAGLQVPIQTLPFRYESTGVETFFTNGLDPDATARRVFCFHRPATLAQWLQQRSTLKGRMREPRAQNRAGLGPAQIRAVENLEASVL